MRYGYFPGCSLKGTGRAYEESLLPVMQHLGVEMVELDDWSCCGATAYMAVDEGKACALAARNLALAEQGGFAQVMAPCSACYLVLNKTQHFMQDYPAMRRLVDKALGSVGLKVSNDTPVRHPLDILLNDVGLDAVKQKVTRPLKGLKVAPYYGCQIVRPYSTFDDQADPVSMDQLLQALGAEVIDWPLKTKCCGGSLTGTLPEAGLRLSYILLKEAKKRGADLIATVCPLCQFNLDGYHDKIEAKWEPVRVPTVYFSQLMGLAFGMPANRLGLQRGFIPMPSLPRAEAVAA
ncbi:MAG: CoB--CoM heterodisulfide reductase iron-sulfur subunit B family protein [Verrucomicrobiales bacterium]|nr:CoB--CoM heterodisulfide reductase iron-sulfur subunit B family protein [Verrucomicrobiales bacterium]